MVVTEQEKEGEVGDDDESREQEIEDGGREVYDRDLTDISYFCDRFLMISLDARCDERGEEARGTLLPPFIGPRGSHHFVGPFIRSLKLSAVASTLFNQTSSLRKTDRSIITVYNRSYR